MMTNAAKRTTVARATLVGLLVGLTACDVGNQAASEPTTARPAISSTTVAAGPEPKHKVEVHLKGIAGADGRYIAGVLFRAKSITDIRYANAVG